MRTTRMLKIALLICGCLLMTGCWDRREVNETVFLTALSIDKGSRQKYEVTFQWANPETFSQFPSDLTKTPITVYTIEGNSIEEVAGKLTEISSRSPSYSHLEAVVIGDEVAREGIHEILDKVGRTFQIRRTKFLLVAEKKGKDLLQAKTLFSIPAFDLREVLSSSNRASTYTQVSYNEFMQFYKAEEMTSFLPILHAVSSKEDRPSKKGVQNTLLKVEGMAFFQGDRVVYQLDGQQTRLWLCVRGKLLQGTPLLWKEGSRTVATFKTVSQSSKFKLNSSVSAEIDIHVTVSTDEIYSDVNESGKKELEKMKAGLEETLEREISQLIVKTQQSKIDIFLFERDIRTRYPQKWKQLKEDWEDTYSSIPMKVNVQVKIVNSGMLTRNALD
ncbi:Ger(x)C family spore germination protein [Paenibacillus radicis (ex Gao et al. 2016)]|uniref:Spore germination protein KC n=1 Tax=Paenibacillus radicis (ex Gao et al. 2016) TaxID=1737354 RepID=A0A917GXJ6_9BACL|nr:Ger(x)C family spore germination protein [Paenibacillus radicis (ex Gao et al. 2016)]GGG60543.1 spore germination protein KC [Paenibacillus radicis (ex Gao et al. 2016)]